MRWMILSLLGLLHSATCAADSCGKNIRVFAHTQQYPQTIVFYESQGHLSGVWRYATLQPRPLEEISIDSKSGATTFKVLWAKNSSKGWETKFHYFKGTLTGDVLQGVFTSDWSSMTPSPVIAKQALPEETKTCADLIRPAEQFRAELQKYLACKSNREAKPTEPIQTIGTWSNQDSDGEHEWGYRVVFFKVGKQVHGLIEDFSGLVGDGGQITVLENITADPSNTKFSFMYSGSKREAVKVGDRLELRMEKLEILKKAPGKGDADLWSEYQNNAAKCDASHLSL